MSYISWQYVKDVLYDYVKVLRMWPMGLCSIMSIPDGDCIIISHPCSIYSIFI